MDDDILRNWWHTHTRTRGWGAGGEQQPCFLVWVYLSITAIKEPRSFPSPADFLQCGTQTLMMDIYGTLHPKLQRKHSFKCTCNIQHGVPHAELFRTAVLTLKEPNSSTVSSTFCENTYEITNRAYAEDPQGIHLGRNLIWLRCLGRLIRHTTALACEAISRDHWFRMGSPVLNQGGHHPLSWKPWWNTKGKVSYYRHSLSSLWASWGEQVHSITCSCMLMFHNTRPWLQATVDWNPQSHSQTTSFHLEG